MKHTREALRREMTRVDNALDQPVKVYLIGGGAMAFQHLKGSTKDIDAVLESHDELTTLAAGLEGAKYTLETELDPEYEDLSATVIYSKQDAPQWDLFNQVVCEKLKLSPGMKERATSLDAGLARLDIRLISPEDIFVFKSITERKADIPDVDSLYRGGLDWDIVLEEMRWQSTHSDQAWAGYFLSTLERLVDAGRQIPILDDVRQLDHDELTDWAVLYTLRDGSKTMDDIIARLQDDLAEEEGPEVIRHAIRRLEESGRILSVEDQYQFSE